MRLIKLLLTSTVCCLVIALGVFLVNQKLVSAAVPAVIINEIMYNPSSGVDGDEFIELYNSTGSAVDLNGWCFNQGVTLCFSQSTVISSHGYGLVSPDSARTFSTYGKTTLGTYTGKLDNGGERVTLVDAATQIVNSVSYDDVAPWPTSPDGGGPSLELKDTTLDNTLAESWGASLGGGGTPAAQNSIYGLTPPSVSLITKPGNVEPTDTPVVKAQISNEISVSLKYRVAFGADITVPMFDDGVHDDGAAGDGLYSSTLPAQTAGALVRYKVVASNGSVTESSPSVNDSQGYHGYVVKDSSVSSNLPMVQWFIPDSDYNSLINDQVYTDTYMNCVFAYGDQVFDNTKVRVKGEYSRTFPKKSFKFKLPSGYKISMPGYLERDITEFHMDAAWLDDSKAMTVTWWQMAKESGIDTPSIFGSRMQRNGEYQGYYIMLEKYGPEFRQEKGYDGQMFEDTNEKIQPNDTNLTPVETFRDTLWGPRTAARRQYLFDNVNIPNVTNFAAFEALTDSHDWGLHNNEIQYQDSNRTGRWSLLPWDRDITMVFNPAVITPYVTPDYFSAIYRAPTTSLYDEFDGRQMYFRRLRTLADYYYGNDNKFLQMYRQNVALSAQESALDIAKWGIGTTENGFWTSKQNSYEFQIQRMKKNLLTRFRLDRAVPAAQPANAVLELSEVNPGITASQAYIVVANNQNTAIDISGWKISPINYTFPVGTVVPANSHVVVPRSDSVYRNAHPGSFIASELGQDLPSSGQLVLERKNNSQADVVWY